MKSRTLCLCAAFAAMLCCASVGYADVLDVVPERSLLAIVARSPDGVDAGLTALARKLTGNEEMKVTFSDDVLARMVLGGRPTAKFTTVDRKASAAVVMVVPAFDQGSPMALVVKVTDYKKFLQEGADAMGAAAAEVTEAGTDMIPGERRAFFFAQLGDYAVIARSEYVIKTFKAEKNRSVAAADPGEIKRMMTTRDLAAYVNLDELVRTFKPQINGAKQGLMRQMTRQFPGEQGEALARNYGAMFDMVVDTFGQTDALSAGVNFGAEGANAEMRVQPVADTRLARIAASLRPAKTGPMDRFDVPAIAAAEWDLNEELVKELVDLFKTFADKSGMVEGDVIEEFMKTYAKMAETMTGPGALTWDAPTEGEKGGVLRIVEVIALKDGDDVKGVLKEQSDTIVKLMDKLQMPIDIGFDYKTDVETHRGCAIDRLTVRFGQKDDAGDPNMMKMIHAFYGPELHEYVAIVNDKLVVAVGYPDTREIKNQIDRILDKKRGNLRQSAFWRDAVKGLPAGRSGVLALSAAKMFQTFMAPAMTQMMGPAGPEVSKAIRGVKFEAPAASAMAFGPANKGIAYHINVPVQEMLNVKRLFKTMTDANPQMKSMRSMNNVRQIGLACMQYANEHDEKYPPNLETLMKMAYLTTPKVFIAPGSGDEVRDGYPADLRAATLAQLKLGPTNCSYVLVKGLTPKAAADTIVIYEKKAFYMGQRCVWFNDGHVEFVPEERFKKLLAEQEKKLKEGNAAP